MNKKILSIFVLVLTLSLTTQTSASLTFTTDAITGTTASSIDLGSGNTLSLQTTGNGAINLGSGLLTSLGGATFNGIVRGLNIYEDTTLRNIAFSSTALKRDTTGTDNIAIGDNALNVNTIGYSNTANGSYTLGSNTIGYENSAFGAFALYTNTTGVGNTAIGHMTFPYHTTGSKNVGIGAYSFYSSTVGEKNTAVGYEAASRSGVPASFDNAVTIGTNLTFVGYQSGLGSPTQRTNATALGAGAYVDADNTVVLGNGSVIDVLMGSTSGATVNAGKYKLSALNTAPATSSEACTVGEIRYTATYIYLCSATDTWVRSAFTSF